MISRTSFSSNSIHLIFYIFAIIKMSIVYGESIDLSKHTIGFVGCGKISSAVCRGFLSLKENGPTKVLVSRRSEDKSRSLYEQFPAAVEIVDDAAEIVLRSEIVFIGLLPGVARSILPQITFTDDKMVISMMAAIDMNELLTLLGGSCSKLVVRTVPLPSAMRRSGPILMYPPNAAVENVLRCVGTPIVCQTEAEMKPMISLTGHISSFYELMRVTQSWMANRGVQEDTAQQFIASFYSSMASAAELSEHSFAELSEEAATPGGLNEQSLRFLRDSEHYPLAEQSLQAILNRLNGK